MKYIANPVEVQARKILEVNETPSQITLKLEDGELFVPTHGMLARMTPVVGDYVVTQADGYIYLNPKDVFERKYRVANA